MSKMEKISKGTAAWTSEGRVYRIAWSTEGVLNIQGFKRRIPFEAPSPINASLWWANITACNVLSAIQVPEYTGAVMHYLKQTARSSRYKGGKSYQRGSYIVGKIWVDMISPGL